MLAEGNPPHASEDGRTRSISVPAWLLALAVGLVALLPRTAGLADFFTIDESYHWIGRVERFAAALVEGDWPATNQTGHPGVTTMWLGALGHALATLLGVQNPGWAGGGAAYLALLRLPLAATNALAVVLGFLLLRRLVHPATALLGALLWALTPFLVAHGRLLHLDALLTSFMTLSVLAALVGVQRAEGTVQSAKCKMQHDEHSESFIVPFAFCISGVFAGLAFLTKAPSLLLLPVIGILALLPPVTGDRHWNRSVFTPSASRRSAFSALISSAFQRLFVWFLAATITVFALWPAMWVGPGAAVGAVLAEIRDNGGQPHHSGNYFLGQPVGVPDARFYPAVVLWRSDPVMVIGLGAYFGFWILDFGLRRRMTLIDTERRNLLALAGFALLFTLALTLQAKKLDRYLLPIFPSLAILAAGGIGRGIERLQAATAHAFRRSQSMYAPAGVAALFLAGTLAFYHPYYLSYFNPLLGGGRVAERVMLVGLGEGMEQVGGWLSTRPDLARGDVLSWIPPTLAPFVPQSTLVRDLRPAYLHSASSYAVLYVRSVQHKESTEAEAYARQSPPLYSVTLHGITYATIHQLPRPFATPVGAVFGEGVHLRGFSQERLGSTLVITPSWDIQADMAGGVVAFVHVLAPDGTRVAQVDAPLDQGMFASWQAGQQFDAPLPVPLPPVLPAGEYRVVLGVYRPEDGARLALQRGMPLPDGIAGSHAIQLTTLRLP
jgi:4-amino-4-deoxy-L-arabinose transferase-like glycosyltransferase